MKLSEATAVTSASNASLIYLADTDDGGSSYVTKKITKANLLSGISQTGAEIKTAYEAESNTNAYTDAEKSKLTGVAASANNYSISSDLLDEDNFASDSATKAASQQSIKAYVDTEVAGLIDSSPASLDTLNELSAALGDDSNYAATVTTSLGLKAPKASPAFTGVATFAGGLNTSYVISTMPSTGSASSWSTFAGRNGAAGNVVTANITADGAATFKGRISQGDGTASGNGIQSLNSDANTANATIYANNYASGGNVWLGFGGGSATSTITGAGNATFAAKTIIGSSSCADYGLLVYNNKSNQSTILAQNYTDAGNVWEGFKAGSPATSIISAEGAATFAGNTTVGPFVAATANSNGGQLKADGNLLLNKNGGEAVTIYNNSAVKTCTIGADGDLYINASDGTNKAKILNDGNATFTGTVTAAGATVSGYIYGDGSYPLYPASDVQFLSGKKICFGNCNVALTNNASTLALETKIIGTAITSVHQNGLSVTGGITATGDMDISDTTSVDLSSNTKRGFEFTNAGRLTAQSYATSPGDQQWRGYQGTTETSEILANGSATFAGTISTPDDIDVTHPSNARFGRMNWAGARWTDTSGNNLIRLDADGGGAATFGSNANWGSMVNATAPSNQHCLSVAVTSTTYRCIQAMTSGGADAFYVTGDGNGTFAGTVSDSVGDLRMLGNNTQSSGSSYSLVLSDSGKTINKTNGGGVTVPQGVFTTGHMVSVINASGNDFTITQGSSFTLYNTADGSTGNRTLAGRGMATIFFIDDGTGYISGGGLS